MLRNRKSPPGGSPITRNGQKRMNKMRQLAISEVGFLQSRKGYLQMDPSDQTFVSLVERADPSDASVRYSPVELDYPVEAELTSATEKLARLEQERKSKTSNDTSRPSYSELADAQDEKKRLEAKVKPRRKLVQETLVAFAESSNVLSQAEKASDYSICSVWEPIVNAGSTLLSNHFEYLEVLKAAEKASAEEEKERQKAESQSRLQAMRLFATGRNTGSATNTVVTPPSGNTITGNDDRAATVVVNGEERNVNEVFEVPEISERARARRMKKRTISKQVQNTQSVKRQKKSDTAKCYSMSTVKEYTNWLNLKWSFTNPKTGEKFGGNDKRGQGIVRLEGGIIWCKFCEQGFLNKRSLTQHLSAQKHVNSYRECNSRTSAKAPPVQTAVTTLRVMQAEQDLAYQSLSNACLEYRVESLRMACKANLTMSALEAFKPFCDRYSGPDLTIGRAHDLPRTVLGALYRTEMSQMRQRISPRNCYPEFGTISDATPLGVEAEAVKVRLVRKSDFRIVEVLSSLKLYARKLNGSGTANHLITAIQKDAGLNPADWRAAMMDRAATNKKCIDDIRNETDWQPSGFPCMSHTLVKPGDSFNCAEAENVRKQYNKGVK